MFNRWSRFEALLTLMVAGLLTGCPTDTSDHPAGVPSDSCEQWPPGQIRETLDAASEWIATRRSGCRFRLERRTVQGLERLELSFKRLPGPFDSVSHPDRLAGQVAQAMGWTRPPLYAGRIDGNYLYRNDPGNCLNLALVLNGSPAESGEPGPSRFIVVEVQVPDRSRYIDIRDLEGLIARLARRLRQIDG